MTASYDLEGATRTVSSMLAELFETEPLLLRVAVASPKEIEAMQISEGVYPTGMSFIKHDGTVVIHSPELDPRYNPETSLHLSLASEFAHLYHRAVKGDNTHGRNIFDPRWIAESRLKSYSGVDTLVLPVAMTQEFILPLAKKEAVDSYCQSYVMDVIDKKLLEKIEEEHREMIGAVGEVLEHIRKQIEIANGNYNRLKKFFRDHRLAMQYMTLGERLGHWMAEKYKEGMPDADAFRIYVRVPVLPAQRKDIEFFQANLVHLNDYLKQNNFSLALHFAVL